MAGRQIDEPITLGQNKYFSALPQCTCPLTDKDLGNRWIRLGLPAFKIITHGRHRAAIVGIPQDSRLSRGLQQ